MESFNMSNDAELILSTYCTSELLSPVVSKLETLTANYYTINKSPLISLFGEIFPSTSFPQLSIFRDNNSNQNVENSSMLEYAKSLLEMLKKVKVSHVTLAFEPSEEYLRVLHSRISAIVGSIMVLHVTVDKKILGGCLLSFDGLYKDLSLVSYINKYFLSNKQYVQKLL